MIFDYFFFNRMLVNKYLSIFLSFTSNHAKNAPFVDTNMFQDFPGILW